MMKKIVIRGLIILVCIVGFIFLTKSLYKLTPNQTALITKFGRVVDSQNTPGLHMHSFIESDVKIYTGEYLYDIPTSDVITADKKSMIADNYIIWHVSEPIKYYQTLSATKGRAEERLEAAVFNATKNVISSMTQDDIVAARGDTLTNMITERANSDTAQYGLTITLAEIKALDLPDDNKQAVFDRMISERNNIAASYKAKGDAEARKIKNDTDKQTAILTAEATKQAEVLKAEGEAQYMSILSEAYNDPEKAEFYSYIRKLDSISSLEREGNTVILDKDSEFARILYGVDSNE